MTKGAGGGMWEASFGCEFFYVGQCVLREWVVGWGELYGYFGEQDLPMGAQECLEVCHRGCLDYISRQFVKEMTARMVNTFWRRRVKYLCWGNLQAWPRSPLRVGCMKT